jgi:phosphopantetheine adenylyltransferase
VRGAILNYVIAAVSGYIWRFAKKEGASIFFRGIRSWEKDGKEERTLQILNTWGPLLLGRKWPIPSVYLSGKPEYNHISSTLIRDLCRAGDCEPLSSLVPAKIAGEVTKLYSRKDN